MNFRDLLGQFIGTVMRAVLAPAMAWLMAKGILTDNETVQVISFIAAIVATILWGVINKFLWSEKVDTALRLPANSTYDQVKQILK